jgi:hypothetical protein
MASHRKHPTPAALLGLVIAGAGAAFATECRVTPQAEEEEA